MRDFPLGWNLRDQLIAASLKLPLAFAELRVTLDLRDHLVAASLKPPELCRCGCGETGTHGVTPVASLRGYSVCPRKGP
jgi:hypothetical protein